MVARDHDHADARAAARRERVGDTRSNRIGERDQAPELELAFVVRTRALRRGRTRSDGDHAPCLLAEAIVLLLGPPPHVGWSVARVQHALQGTLGRGASSRP
jgi:hypothetical protein